MRTEKAREPQEQSVSGRLAGRARLRFDLRDVCYGVFYPPRSLDIVSKDIFCTLHSVKKCTIHSLQRLIHALCAFLGRFPGGARLRSDPRDVLRRGGAQQGRVQLVPAGPSAERSRLQ